MLFFFGIPAFAMAADSKLTTIASCGESSGYAYYAETKMVPRDKAGWQKDGISGGRVLLAKLPNGSFDLIYYDRTEMIRSSSREGAVITIAMSNDDELIVNIRYSETMEIYTFWSTRSGKLQYAHLQSKSAPLLTKQALFIGECSEINFRRIRG